MKILAIRGKNLASLSAEFEVDFQSEPLASAGLFAITGPTGSGKSTLLDALCLALYEKTPRLTGVGRSADIPDVGGNGITPGDVRTILRRGAAEGFAEVDFVGSDGVAYRSRWIVRRAHRRIDGAMQKSDMELTRILDGQRLGEHRKADTLRLIETCIGLSFEQFTRAVLLAQNDFSTFLKASDDDRAELLQTLTGTENFSAISMQAFARMKTEKDYLLRLQGQLEDQAPMGTELRAQKDAELKDQSNNLKILEQKKSVLESQLRWYQQWDQLKVAESEAAQHLEQAIGQKQAAASRHEHLALVERVQPARPLWAEQLRLNQAVEASKSAIELAKTALTTSQGDVATHQAGHDAALHQRDLADTAKKDVQPAIDSARALDASIVAITPQFAAAIQAQQTAGKNLQSEQLRQKEALARMESTKADLATSQQWLLDNAQLRPLADGWQRWEALFAQAQQMIDSQSKTATQIADLEKDAATVEQSVNTAALALNQATKALEADLAQLQTLSQECLAVDVEKLVAQKLALEQYRDQVQTASQLWQKCVQAQKQLQQKTLQRQSAVDALAKSDASLLDFSNKLPLLERELQTAEESLNLATLAASQNADSMRAALQIDQPCPVCGSVDHPYATHTPAMDDLLKKLGDFVKLKRKVLRDLQASIAIASAARTSAELSMEQIGPSLTQLEGEIANLDSEWNAHALHAQVDLVPEPDRAQWLSERQDSVRRDLESLASKEALYRETVKRKDAAQSKVNTAQATLAKTKESLNSLNTKHKTTVHALEIARQQLSDMSQHLTALEGQLDGAFPGPQWRVQWRQNPNTFVSQCSASAHAWIERQTSIATLASNLTAFEVGMSACENAILQATGHLKNQTESLDAVTAILDSYRTGRAALFDGRPVAEVESALNAAIQIAHAACVSSQAALHQAQAEVARRLEAISQSEALLEQHRIALEDARFNLNTWLSNFNTQSQELTVQSDFALDALESLLEIAPEWIVGEREALQLLDRALTTAQAVYDTRKQSRIAHEAEKTVAEELDVLQESLAQLVVAIAAMAETLSTLKLEIAKDDERLRTSQSLRAAIDKQAAVSRVWAQLSDLIGSADGKKFRNFAQQLTLDILLTYGNQHLQSLTRRYRLQRIKDSLGLLVVDQDMGDEIRSVHSLSGGESFLVSLALALGLASLSSHRVRVESLFIDEGFGSLDADSLSIAMDALDKLQSQGRKVGVISHVQEMTERIGTRVQVQRQSGGLSRIVVC